MFSYEILGCFFVFLLYLYGNIIVNDFFFDGRCLMVLVIIVLDFIIIMYVVFNYYGVSGI